LAAANTRFANALRHVTSISEARETIIRVKISLSGSGKVLQYAA